MFWGALVMVFHRVLRQLSSITGGVPVMLFPDEMKIEIGWPSRADGPLQG